MENLINIWERGNTFPLNLIADFKQKLKGQAAPAQVVPSRTPPGSPPRNLLESLGINGAQQPSAPPQPAVSQPDAASVLRALAGMGAQTQQTAPAPPPALPAPAPQDLSAILSSLGQPQSLPQAQPVMTTPVPQLPQFSTPLPPQQTSMPPQFPALFPGPPPLPIPQQFQPPPQQPQNPMAALAALIPPHILSNPDQLTKVLQLFQELMKANIPQDQWGPVVAALYPPSGQQPTASFPQPSVAQPMPTPSWQPSQQNDYRGGGRRDRSRSPDFRRDRGNNPGRRPSPVYGVYDASVREVNDGDDHKGRRQGSGRYRQRTPPGGRDDFEAPTHNLRPKWTDLDPTVKPGHIKVLSRTLFVGGANGTEAEIRAIFGRYGPVQTCIVNNDKRHAFVKMCSRADAVAARAGMENMKDPEVLAKARQTKWGVGFGPRECCDYSTGVSIIPIDALTEADNKWVHTAEFGGTGGRAIESGLVFEEPDIEIGAGVSSKAMSRRVGPDTGRRGGRGGGGGHDGGRQRYRQPEPRYESPRPEPVTIQPPPAVPSFGFNFAMPGMPPY